jgi:hypothetical protein
MVERFAPRHTGVWDTYEASAVRKISRSLLETAVFTGVAWRLLRALMLGTGPADSALFIGGVLAAGLLVVLGMATLHIGNYPLKRWVWRVPAFALVVTAAEVAVSCGLIALGREPYGSGVATWSDLPDIITWTLLPRLIVLGIYAAILALIVQGVRRSEKVIGEMVVDEPGDDEA